MAENVGSISTSIKANVMGIMFYDGLAHLQPLQAVN